MENLNLAALLALVLVGCQSGDDGAASSATSSATPSAVATATTTASQAPPVPAAVAAVRAGKLTHPGTKEELELVKTSLGKCYGFKGYSMMLPKGSKLETVAGARACAAFLPKAYKKFGFMVMTDEIKVKMWKRTDVENIKRKHLDDPDAFIYEIEDKGKRKVVGWTDGKVGPHRVQCNSMRDEGTMSIDDELAFIEVCRTLEFDESAKK